MLTLIKNAQLYTPEYLGKKDILLASDKIQMISDEINLSENSGLELEIIDSEGYWVVPGFIDNHVHLIGGGGEGGYNTRTPEIQLSKLTEAGITTVIGVLGTDGTTRHMTSLLAKARALESEGISTYILTGSYQIPVHTITGNVRDDLVIIDKVIGVGEIAISDHRSSKPTLEEIKKLSGEARVGGMLSGKPGVINLHLGDEKDGLRYLNQIVENTDIPCTQFLPTHINRSERLLEEGVEYTRNGGYIDLTTSGASQKIMLKPSKILRKLKDSGVDLSKVTLSSDGQGSLPSFDEEGNFKGLGIGSVNSLYSEVRDAILHEKLEPQEAISTITQNVAEIYKLADQGRILEGNQANLVFLDQNDLTIDSVYAKGELMVSHKKVLKKGTFE
ncbi:beta-aspartyl-peptidase [Natranaerobius thermophilus]|uniref:Isoaspartyl dipeptidase n=1 Tax=Natranaerobius thermophilus (strain ATCC BAA-1301 / DSM 18059 / JW/NM-WN-LF) TaxID=457570 RepID=B2A7R5_NATTJ|nr:beta-aspartyl-peptidase [Natranaerobius thermophilus]ACB84367.1 isoaspartyl dipeptidase [Natranaerobius thermophilus JW/NM-WN-LF]